MPNTDPASRAAIRMGGAVASSRVADLEASVRHYASMIGSGQRGRLPAQCLGGRDEIGSALAGFASGRELVERGCAEDVELAACVDVSDCVPRLIEGGYARLDPEGRTGESAARS